MEIFKNRLIDKDKPIELYRCLNRKGFIFSIRQNGKVIGHSGNIILKDCEMIINKGGKKRCIKEQCRNVHAFIRGFITDNSSIKLENSFILNYNPYSDKGFYNTILGDVNKSSIVYLKEGKILFQL